MLYNVMHINTTDNLENSNDLNSYYRNFVSTNIFEDFSKCHTLTSFCI